MVTSEELKKLEEEIARANQEKDFALVDYLWYIHDRKLEEYVSYGERG